MKKVGIGSARRAGISPEVLRSPAWRALSDNARAVIITLARQYNGRNNGHLTFEPFQGAPIGLSTEETGRALLELEAVGLVDSRLPGEMQ